MHGKNKHKETSLQTLRYIQCFCIHLYVLFFRSVSSGLNVTCGFPCDFLKTVNQDSHRRIVILFIYFAPFLTTENNVTKENNVTNFFFTAHVILWNMKMGRQYGQMAFFISEQTMP